MRRWKPIGAPDNWVKPPLVPTGVWRPRWSRRLAIGKPIGREIAKVVPSPAEVRRALRPELARVIRGWVSQEGDRVVKGYSASAVEKLSTLAEVAADGRAADSEVVAGGWEEVSAGALRRRVVGRWGVAAKSEKGGRNHRGKITCYHRGGGHKRQLRRVDLNYWRLATQGVKSAVVVAFHYDPNRTARLALLRPVVASEEGALVPVSGAERVSVLATSGREVGGVVSLVPGIGAPLLGKPSLAWDSAESKGSAAVSASVTTPESAPASEAAVSRSGEEVASVAAAAVLERAPGTRLPLKEVPSHYRVHSVELVPGGRARLIRSGGAGGRVINHVGSRVRVQLPSGEHRRISGDCRCTLGTVLGESHRLTASSHQAGGITRVWQGWSKTAKELPWPKGKAGRSRWLGTRPTVRGTARNPIDHPHGGGQGKTSGGRPSVSPWSVAKGVRTSSGRGERFVVIPRRAA